MEILRRHIVPIFFGLTFIISWGAWGWVNAAHQGLTGWVPLVALLGAFGPCISGVLCTAITQGSQGIRILLRRMIAVRADLLTYVAVLVGPLILVILPVGLNAVSGGSAPRWAELRNLVQLLPTAGSMLIIGGLTEEPGWRGFALPILKQKHGPLRASLLLGGLWGIWHIPIYLLPGLGNPIPIPDLMRFLAVTPLLAILFTALAERSNDSVWIAMLFHAWFNTVFARLPNLLSVAETAQLQFFYDIVLFGAVIPILWSWFRSAGLLHSKAHGGT
jgi:membrane protease YdiL (CAAX protease family)